MKKEIFGFSGENRPLSNMSACKVMWGDHLTPERLWPCTEVPYFLSRLDSLSGREKIIETAKSTYERSRVLKTHDESVEIAAKSVKNLWKKIGPGVLNNPEKFKVMKALVFDKIGRNEHVQEVLKNTDKIFEANHWGDTLWGVHSVDDPSRGRVKGFGENNLGIIIMEGRDLLELHGPDFLINKAKEIRDEITIDMNKKKDSLTSNKGKKSDFDIVI